MLKFLFAFMSVFLLCNTAAAIEFDDYEKQLRQERAATLSAYLAEHPEMNAVIDRLEASYYADLSHHDFVLADIILNNHESLVELYNSNNLAPAKSVPVYYVQFTRYEEGGNSFSEMLGRLAKTPFASIAPDIGIGMYQISINDAKGQSVGTASCLPATEPSNALEIYPWDGNTIETYTLKPSADMLRALLATPLDLARVKVHNVSFSGHGGAVFFDDKNAYFTPVMGDIWTSDCGLEIDKLYPLAKAIAVFEKAFAD